MNVIFLTLVRITDIQNRGIYTDLMRKFRDMGHQVFIVCPSERRYGMHTFIDKRDGVTILSVKTLNIQKTNIVEKGMGTILLESQFKNAIRHKLHNVRFDLILYSTPPITITNVVKYLKRSNPNALSYLLLKDIFPQNAVDLGMMSTNSPLYKFFRKKEKNLYRISDYIGCMSPANVEYVLTHNDIDGDKVEVNPNSIEVVDSNVSDAEKREIRKKYGLPIDNPIFIYGGNLGKPQGIDFLIQCLQANINREDCYFLIVGSGTEYDKLKQWFDKSKPKSALLLSALPKSDYDKLVRSCEIGLIFLDRRFTIPNFPSRILSYLENKMPVIAVTDPNTDIGEIICKNRFGYSCLHGDLNKFNELISRIIVSKEEMSKMGESGFQYLLNHYQVQRSYQIIMKHFNGGK